MDNLYDTAPPPPDEIDYDSLREVIIDAHKRISKTQAAISSIIAAIQTTRTAKPHVEAALTNAFEKAISTLDTTIYSLEEADTKLLDANETISAVLDIRDAENALKLARERLAEIRSDAPASDD